MAMEDGYYYAQCAPGGTNAMVRVVEVYDNLVYMMGRPYHKKISDFVFLGPVPPLEEDEPVKLKEPDLTEPGRYTYEHWHPLTIQCNGCPGGEVIVPMPSDTATEHPVVALRQNSWSCFTLTPLSEAQGSISGITKVV